MKILSLNVCGLLNRLKVPEFVGFLSKHDFICLSETKLDDADVYNVLLPGFTYIPCNRKKFSRKSGGIGLFVRQEIVDGQSIKILDSRCSNLLLFELHENLIGFKLVCGVIYVEPEGTKYAQKDVFDNIENVLADFADGPLLLLGDFNARSGVLADVDYVSGGTVDGDDICRDYTSIEDDIITLKELGFPLSRHSMDKKVNNYGRKLVSLCRNFGLLIGNGRLGRDAFIGKFTSNGVSVIDYILASPCLFPKIHDFYVVPFDECLSDDHCPVVVVLKKKSNDEHILPDLSDKSDIPCKVSVRWEDRFSSAFVENLDYGGLSELNVGLDNAIDKGIDQTEIDSFYEIIKKVLHSSAEKCGSVRYVKKSNSRNYRKRNGWNPWWNSDCEEKRTAFNKARKSVKVLFLVMCLIGNPVAKATKKLLTRQFTIITRTCTRN